jgi:mRNA interferase MazF
VNLRSTKGGEQAGRRLVVIVSGNLLNTYASVVYVCPLTTKIKNYKGDVVLSLN